MGQATTGSFGRMSWHLGVVRITRVVEQVLPFPVDFFAEATIAGIAAEAWLVPDYVDAHGQYLMSIHTLVVEDGARRIVVGTCSGNSKVIAPAHRSSRRLHGERFIGQMAADCRSVRRGIPCAKGGRRAEPMQPGITSNPWTGVATWHRDASAPAPRQRRPAERRAGRRGSAFR